MGYGYFEKNINDLRSLSSAELFRLSKKVEDLAKKIKKDQPTIEMALSAGIVDRSYKTVRHGWVSSYEGEAVIETENAKWHCKGTKPRGNASSIWEQGDIEFSLIRKTG